jgi:hypothetical protein
MNLNTILAAMTLAYIIVRLLVLLGVLPDA